MESILGSVLGAAVTAFAGWATRWLTKWLRAKTDNEALASALRILEHAVDTSVREVEQVLVPRLREDGDSKLNKKAAAEAKSAAVDRATRLLGDSGINRLSKAMQLSKGAVYDLLRSKVESTVHRLKR